MNGILDFLSMCENLKTTKRTGWIDNGIPNPESIADHMHRMSLIVLLLPCPSFDVSRAMKMALVHDLAEALCGDITPTQKIPKIEKHEIEKRALDEMLVVLEGSLASQEIMDLWKEYEEEESEIALFVKDVDKFEMILQAFEYEKRELKRMDTFFDSTRCKFKHGFIIGLVEALNKRRNAYFESINGQ